MIEHFWRRFRASGYRFFVFGADDFPSKESLCPGFLEDSGEDGGGTCHLSPASHCFDGLKFEGNIYDLYIYVALFGDWWTRGLEFAFIGCWRLVFGAGSDQIKTGGQSGVRCACFILVRS